MKKIIAIAITLLLVAFMGSNAEAQKQYKYGYKVAPVTVASALTVSVTPYASLSQYEITADTNVTVNVVATKSLPGDIVTLKVKGNVRQRTLTLGTNIEAAAQTIGANKTIMYLFVYNGTNYYLSGSGAVD